MVKSDLRHSIQCQASSDELRGIQDVTMHKGKSSAQRWISKGWKEIHPFFSNGEFGMPMHIDE